MIVRISLSMTMTPSSTWSSMLSRISSAVAMKSYPALPRRVRLLNTGAELPWAVERLPEFNDANGVGRVFLHLRNIPVDELASEAIVLEIEWENA